MKTVILAPLDPVHDNAVKLLQRKLTEAGYGAIALPPGVTAEEVIERALTEKPAAILVSRTLGYKVAETLSGLVDLADAAGLRPHTRLGVGGMAVTREIGAELGFDGVFSGDLNMAAVIAFIENRPVEIEVCCRSCSPCQTRYNRRVQLPLQGCSDRGVAGRDHQPAACLGGG